MLTLNCAIVGIGGSTFPVDIDKKKLVGYLKTAIKDEIGYAGLAYQLRLFLAKHGNLWLKDDDTLDKVLQSRDATSYVEVRASEEIGNLFGNSPTKKTIHVLVMVPKGPNHGDGQCVRYERMSDLAAVSMAADGDALLAFLEVK
ncbi:hypothetical protein V7S43_015921 [Phytophthora oleae]|uniref:Crinkler effector protein N-terminal domain-containing protein n=1 Tax=Phytophthora oleae TaxID=2107226 RepID=A0ABD3EXP3_9STRA